MKRILTVGVACGLMACGGGNTAVELVPEGTAGQTLGSSGSGLEGSSGTARARAVRVTISEVLVHVAGAKKDGGDDSPVAEDQKGPRDSRDDDGGVEATEVDDGPSKEKHSGWRTLSSSAREVDLLALTVESGTLLGDIDLPGGKITQVRLRLDPTGIKNGQKLLADAVEEADGTKCDLLVPQSAFEPGLKITGVFKQLDVDPANRRTLQLAFDLKDAHRVADSQSCTWRLHPVLKLHKVREE